MKPDNKIFCTKRTWDQRAEHGWMKSIEDEFNESLRNYYDNNKPVSNYVVTKYFLLWVVRSHYASRDNEDVELAGVSPTQLSKTEEEVLERKWCSYVGKSGKLKSRFSVSLSAQIEHDKLCSEYSDIKWGTLNSEGRPFLLPKFASPHGVLPVTPLLALSRQYGSMRISDESVYNINKQVFESEKELVISTNIGDALRTNDDEE